MNGKIFHKKGEAVVGKTKQVLKIVIFVAIAGLLAGGSWYKIGRASCRERV